MTAPEPFEIEVVSRDGDVCRADVYLPEPSARPAPVLLAASPYQKALMSLPSVWTFPFRETGPVDLYLDEGYAFVWMDVPGSGHSAGTWDPVSRREGEAIHDVIEWVAAQEWCNGKVGMYGQSYYCWSQWNAARTRPAHLATIAAFDGATDMYRDWMYHGGIPVLTFIASWTTTTMLQHQATGHDIRSGDRHLLASEIYHHRLDDEWHRSRSPFWELDQVDIPVFSIGCWGKGPLHLRGNVLGYERVRGPKKLLITHADSFPAAQRLFADRQFHRRELLPWYDHHLKGADNGVMDRPAVRFYVQGEEVYRAASAWPPEQVSPTAFYLSGKHSGVVNSLNDGSMTEAAPTAGEDSFSWSYPDPQWLAGVTTFDEEGRPDHVARVVTYTTAPFEREREFTGHGVLVLHASTDQSDLDVYAKLTILSSRPGGGLAARRVCQGWLRASHRAEDPQLTKDLRPFHTHAAEEALEPGRPYELRVELLPMSFLVRPGERLRLELSNADSPIAESLFHHWYGLKVGTDRYHHDAAHPSRLVLPERAR